MELEFKTRHLRDLYEKGRSKKYKLQTWLVERFVDRIDRIEAAETIFDLREPPSMKFEALEGHANKFSIRLNDQYRLEFEIEFSDKEKTKGNVMVIEVSKHYE